MIWYVDFQDAFDPFADTDEDDEMATKSDDDDEPPGTPRPGSPVTEPPEPPLLTMKKSLPWRSKVR